MITVEDLMKWANEHAIGRSPSVPKGWIDSRELFQLAREVEGAFPHYVYQPVNYMDTREPI